MKEGIQQTDNTAKQTSNKHLPSLDIFHGEEASKKDTKSVQGALDHPMKQTHGQNPHSHAEHPQPVSHTALAVHH